MDDKEGIKQLFVLIEKLRLYKNLNKRDLAIAADITPQYYSELVKGEKVPSMAVVIRMLRVLDAELRPVFAL